MRHFYIDSALNVGETLMLPADLQHRLAKVLRMEEGDELALFNGMSGLVAAQLADGKARAAKITRQMKPQTELPTLHLALVVPKRDAWETALRQATELGATVITPLKTAFSQVSHIKEERAQGILVEASEQCERLSLPTLNPLQPLDEFLATLNAPCAWAYERGTPAAQTRAHILLIGPEGGFSAAEVEKLQAHPHIKPFTLGQTILRVDTAVVAGLALLNT